MLAISAVLRYASLIVQHERRVRRNDYRRYAIDTHTHRGSYPVPRGARQGLGRTGERLAADELTRRGYHVLEHNFRCVYGEIDLIAEVCGELVFIEVKTRRGKAYGLPEEAVTLRKKQKIVQVATYYLDQHEAMDHAWRIDVVAVQMSIHGELEEIRVYPHAVTS